MKRVFTTIVVICMMMTASIAWSIRDIIYVDCHNTGGPWDGTPEHPYQYIQDGIDAAVDGDGVWVAWGTYTGAGNRDIDFKGKAIEVRGFDEPIIDCENNGRGFYFHSGETETSVVDGFTIQNGWAYGDGGGIWCSSSPTIADNTITGNLAEGSGGGIWCSSSATISGNTITGNEAYNNGGIWCSSSATISDNTITGNSAYDGGGGIYCDYFSSPTITNNTISGNSTESDGGGIYCHPSHSSQTITNNTITENEADFRGGGIFCYRSSPTIINNTITGNSGEKGGGIYCEHESSPIVLNTIFWEDSPDEIYVDDSSYIDITYSDIQGGWPGEGNIDADPLFVDAGNGNYHLSDDSPCIGAGIMTPDVPDRDIDKNPRPNPADSDPDIGAYENPLGEPEPIDPPTVTGVTPSSRGRSGCLL